MKEKYANLKNPLYVVYNKVITGNKIKCHVKDVASTYPKQILAFTVSLFCLIIQQVNPRGNKMVPFISVLFL